MCIFYSDHISLLHEEKASLNKSTHGGPGPPWLQLRAPSVEHAAPRSSDYSSSLQFPQPASPECVLRAGSLLSAPLWALSLHCMALDSGLPLAITPVDHLVSSPPFLHLQVPWPKAYPPLLSPRHSSLKIKLLHWIWPLLHHYHHLIIVHQRGQAITTGLRGDGQSQQGLEVWFHFPAKEVAEGWSPHQGVTPWQHHNCPESVPT